MAFCLNCSLLLHESALANNECYSHNLVLLLATLCMYRSDSIGLHITTFRVSRRRREMYCGHRRLCVFLCVCPRPHAHTIPRHECNLGNGSGCPLVVHYRADLQSVHGLRCYGNNANPSYTFASTPRHDDIVRTQNVSECSVLPVCLVHTLSTIV